MPEPGAGEILVKFTPGALWVLDSGLQGGERVVAGSLETVTHTTANTLMQLGLKADVTESGSDVYINSKSAKGGDFTLVLTRVQTDLAPYAQVEQNPLMEGRQMVMMFGPKKK